MDILRILNETIEEASNEAAHGELSEEELRYPELDSAGVTYRIILICVLLILSFFANIFNIALMGVDIDYLKLLTKGPFQTEKDLKDCLNATRIIPLRAKGNWTLCSILFTNVTCQSYVSILMAELFRNEFIGLGISTPPIVLIGGIIP